MTAHALPRLACLLVLAVTSSRGKEQTRWSRQISSYTSDIGDWVPLTGPVQEPEQIKRQAVAEPRILSEPFPTFPRATGFNQDIFPSRSIFQNQPNRQLYLQSVPAVPSAPQNYLTDQGFGQNIRFGLAQPNFPLNQGFISPQFPFDTIPQIPSKPRPQIPQSNNPIKFEDFSKSPTLSPQAKPFINQAPKTNSQPESPKFVDGYRAENISTDYAFNSKKIPQSLQKLKFDSLDKVPKPEAISNKGKVEREEVQLLYVPVESLNRGQFNFRAPIATPQLVNTDLYSQSLPKLNPIKQTFAVDFQRPIIKPVENFSFGQNYFSNFNAQLNDLDQIPKFSTISSPFPTAPPTTPKPKKLKPHQPPLAVFLSQETTKGNQVKVGDVLSTLKNANTIAVLDSVNPLNAPRVFIGPSSLKPPENFVKFDLPYLSNIENTDKKLRQLPFFVAPLSYHTPDGFAKIPFPSPHVGSVVINSQIKETTAQSVSTPIADITQNTYSPSYRQEQKPVTQKPTISFYSTSVPKTNVPSNHQSNYYSFEPQTVTSIRPPKEPEASLITAPPKTGSYFLNNIGTQYNTPQYVTFPESNYNTPETIEGFNIAKQNEVMTTTTQRTTTTTTTPKSPSTYPSQLLETHNPYSINQAFHFSTPLDYHSFFDEGVATPGFNQLSSPKPTLLSSSASPPTKSIESVTEKQQYQGQNSSPNYLQNYTPEIQYESEVQSSRFPIYNSNEYTSKTEFSPDYNKAVKQSDVDNKAQPLSSFSPPTVYNAIAETQAPVFNSNLTEAINEIPTTPSDTDIQSTRSPYNYNQYENFDSNESKDTSSTTTTTTTTRKPLRSRGRPRYTTPRTDSNESTYKSVVTRRPLRERRPISNQPRYQPNRITTETSTRKSNDPNESTTKSYRTRTRGQIHYKPSENDEIYESKRQKSSSKENDLAYQRDILHQNYPVTLMERKSTVDIEAITEPSPKISLNKNLDTATEIYDVEHAYTNERATISQHIPQKSNEDIPIYTSRQELQQETSFVPKQSSTRSEDYYYQSRSSSAPIDALSYDETSPDEDEGYVKQTTPVSDTETPEIATFATEPISPVTEQNIPSYSVNDEYSVVKQEEIPSNEDIEAPKTTSQEMTKDNEQENIIQTTPSYNRVRIRPGVIRQYHQASTESSRTKIDRRRPVQAITYRPAFDRRRTTMRIDEIEADLKTKQIHARPEVQDYKHPVYKPDPTTEPPVTSSTPETITKRGHFRRRRPTYSATSTEATSTRRNSYEVKNRSRGRRPTTEKSTEKPEIQTDKPTTVRNSPYSRYSHRPRLSERYNKKPEPTETEDQDSNYSINRPKLIAPESEQWSPKFSSDSFKPYNPNDIVDDKKIASTERKHGDGNDEFDIITARNEYEDVLISVTPATNHRVNKKIPDIPPTLEALVEQSKIGRTDSNDAMSTFESMLEEVMKSLEEQDEHEYTSNVMKHKGGEIGEIPPERIIASGESAQKTTTLEQREITTMEPTAGSNDSVQIAENETKNHRRGFWKKIKVRPLTTESFEAAESQFYHHTVNQFGEPIKPTKTIHDKAEKYDKSKVKVTTYKPSFQFIKDIFETEEDTFGVLPAVDVPKVNSQVTKENKPESATESTKLTTEFDIKKETPTEETDFNPGDMDLGTGSPDPTVEDMFGTSTETSSSEHLPSLDRSDGFSLMDYLFGVTSSDSDTPTEIVGRNEKESENKTSEIPDIKIDTEPEKSKVVTTETSFIGDELTTERETEVNTESVTLFIDIKKMNSTEKPREEGVSVDRTEKSVVKVETSSVSSFMDPANVVSTSMSTEVSHETEICFRGKCIKTSKDIL